MMCPMISAKRLEPYECHGSDCAWWIGDKERGDCAVKFNAMSTGDLGEISNSMERIQNSLENISDKIQGGTL